MNRPIGLGNYSRLRFKALKTAKPGKYGKKVKFTYFSAIVEHRSAGKRKIVFIKTKEKLIPIVSTYLEISDEEIIEIYKRRWDIGQGYKEPKRALWIWQRRK